MRFATFIAVLIVTIQNVAAQKFDFVTPTSKVSIVYSADGNKLDSISANLLAADIKGVTGYQPVITNNITKVSGNVIIIGTIKSKTIQSLKNAYFKQLEGKWECYSYKILQQPFKNIRQALVIAGSDSRGVAYGVFGISEKIGVSPWYWWADVHPKKKKSLSLNITPFTSTPPLVKFRGIFINDEDWGLQPWAAKTFEPETNDIGPKTYAKVFELLLRLKANLIWPAMHPSTKAFFYYPGNVKTAEDYQIVIGSSHAEPMLRNNVGEWNEKAMGHFNYITNKDTVYKYWEDRVKESSGINGMYTIGMRGVHDSQMEGVKNAKEAVPLVEEIIKDQRLMLSKYVNKDVTAIPQVFTAYKEVLDVYDNGLKVPEDVTVVWPDDNYGYIQRLSNEKEQTRKGGGGVYYHASYWGRPHDYLWISSTHPSLIREEMMKAYETGAKNLWVLNVGDIKPLEYNIELFMDMAFNPLPFKDSRYTKQHLLQWATDIFGKDKAQKIQPILWEYYQLAFERRPEFMGWSQTEPTTQTKYTEYNHFYYGDEAQQRIDKYDDLEKKVKAIRSQIESKDADAFYQLVYYPVVGASLMNKKFIYRDKSYLYAKQNRLSASDYSRLSTNSYDSIVSETAYYNEQLSNGKWKNIMSMKPRDLPVFRPPVLAETKMDKSAGWSIAPEGFADTTGNVLQNFALRPFSFQMRGKYFVDIFLSDEKTINWKASTSKNWVKLSQSTGMLSAEFGKKQIRIWINIDWSKVTGTKELDGVITFEGGDKQIVLKINVDSKPNTPTKYKGYIETNGYVSMYASNYTRQINHDKQRWTTIHGLGVTGQVIEALPLTASSVKDTSIKNRPHVEYDFYMNSSAKTQAIIYSLPTHPLNNNHSMRYAVSVDDGPLKIIDFKTVGRSEEWKQNVLRNNAIRKVDLQLLNKGKHVLKIYMMDPGVILDRIIIDLGGYQKAYSKLPETKAQ